MIVIVEGEIVGKQRPRVCKHGTYTPKKTKDSSENTVAARKTVLPDSVKEEEEDEKWRE